METRPSEITTIAALAEKKKLRKGLRRFDMICYTVVAVIGLNALGAFASNGAQAFTWLLLSAVTFFLPYGLLVAELGSTFPQEGGIYVWCKLAGGRLYAAFAATLYWITVPLLIGGSTAVIMIVALKIFWFGDANVLFGGHVVTDVLVELAFALLFIWGITFGAIISLRHGKWISTVGFFVKLALLSIFLVLAGIFVVSGSGNGAHVAVADLVPTNWGLIASSILPIVVVLWLGAEMQSSAAEEMANAQRDVPLTILRAGIIVVILYSLFLLAILFALPTESTERRRELSQCLSNGQWCAAPESFDRAGMAGGAGFYDFAVCLWRNVTHRREPDVCHRRTRSRSTTALRPLQSGVRNSHRSNAPLRHGGVCDGGRIHFAGRIWL